ncbi:Exocyst complex component 7 [Coelomomyces lativittatus]|nr:Exocyst complex component 7 [Coelomomyces lativittatus]
MFFSNFLFSPNEADLTPFLQSLGRVNEALAFLLEAKFTSGEKAIYKLRQIHNLGIVQLVQIFKKWLTQLSTPLAHLPRLENPPPYTAESIQTIAHLATWLAACPVPLDPENKPETTYVHVRSVFLTNSLTPLTESTLEDALKKVSASFILLVTWLHKLLHSERDVMQRVLGPQVSTRAWESLITSAFELVIETGKKVLSLVKKKNDFSLVFVLFDVLEFWSVQRDIISTHFVDLPKKGRALEAMFDSWTVAALKIIPDFLDEIKHLSKGPIPSDATVHESTTNAMVFLKKLLDYPDATESILQTIGESNWTTSNLEITEVQYVKNSNGVLVQKYFGMVLNILEVNLEAKAKQYKRPLFGALFLLNNMNYLNKSIRANSKSPPSLCERFDVALKKYKEQFLDISFRPLLTHLMDVTVIQGGAIRTGLSPGDRNMIKEKFKSFNNDLDELVKTLKSVSIFDNDMKLSLIKEGHLVIVPMYERFYSKYYHTDFSKNKEKYIKYDIPAVKTTLNELFNSSPS